jgi:hypothetical protein
VKKTLKIGFKTLKKISKKEVLKAFVLEKNSAALLVDLERNDIT